MVAGTGDKSRSKVLGGVTYLDASSRVLAVNLGGIVFHRVQFRWQGKSGWPWPGQWLLPHGDGRRRRLPPMHSPSLFLLVVDLALHRMKY